ncbi:cell envelope integrity EipB family protein [Pinisolibacter sp.]|uniref:cell envelope integrity EipB family protein n=1 Tax=Pinisolibacter sp. TaxID=2172024 RepID=UPI002FDEED35
MSLRFLFSSTTPAAPFGTAVTQVAPVGAALALAAILAAAAPAVAGPGDTLRGFAAHRAVYEMTLARRNDRADVLEVSGRLVYEFSGNTCDGFSSRFRLVTRLTNNDGRARVTDMRTTSFEDGAGKSFDFVNQNLVDGRTIEDTKGIARHDGAATRVTLAGGDGKPIDLPAEVRFPTEHMVDLLEAAKAGRSLAEIDLFDGSDGGRKVFRTTVVIGREQSGADDTAGEPAADAALTEGKRRWPVEISYFDRSKPQGDVLPDYQLGFLLYENGVSRQLRLDYGDFAIGGRLSSLEALPAGECK